MRIALTYLINIDEAEEAVNNSFFKAFTKIDNFSGTYLNFAGWIKRIVINESIDLLRKKRTFTKNHVSVDYVDQISVDPADLSENTEEILALLKRLPQKMRIVFNLFVFEGYGHREIGSKLAISEANSKWNLHQARKLLKVWIVEKKLV